jgi:predicted nucleic-acid-binding protein
MKISHEAYLKQLLDSKKFEMDRLNQDHRVSVAIYDIRKSDILDQIRSIEGQLDSHSDEEEELWK